VIVKPFYMVTCSALLAVAALAPASVRAASYKCVVDGKTTYQGQPCADQSRGREATGPAPAPAVATHPGATSAPKADASRRDGVAEAGLEPMARDAFAAMKGGNLSAYSAMLCPRPRAALSGKGAADQFRSEGQGYTRSRAELGKAAGIDREGVTFVVTDPAGGGAKDSKAQRMVRVHFDWVDGKPCVTYIDSMVGAQPK
jgi:hypothetical protein